MTAVEAKAPRAKVAKSAARMATRSRGTGAPEPAPNPPPPGERGESGRAREALRQAVPPPGIRPPIRISGVFLGTNPANCGS